MGEISPYLGGIKISDDNKKKSVMDIAKFLKLPEITNKEDNGVFQNEMLAYMEKINKPITQGDLAIHFHKLNPNHSDYNPQINRALASLMDKDIGDNGMGCVARRKMLYCGDNPKSKGKMLIHYVFLKYPQNKK